MNIRKEDLDKFARRNMTILNMAKSAKAHGKQKKVKKKRDYALYELDHMYKTLIHRQMSRIQIQYERTRSIRKTYYAQKYNRVLVQGKLPNRSN